jgi:hypothetical protein
MSKDPENPGRRPFRVIRGGRVEKEEAHGAVHVFLGPRGDQPFPVDAFVLEEDTFLVLSAPPEGLESRGEHPIRMMTALMDVEPLAVGSVTVRDRNPLELLAIVHDFNAEPSWSEDSVGDALDAAFAECERRSFTRVGLEMLGAVHGTLSRPRFLQLLRQALARAEPRTLERIWLVAPE